MRRKTTHLLLIALALASVLRTEASSPPGNGPFGSNILSQPVPGAARAVRNDGWKSGKLCDVSSPPYSATNNSNATAALQQAIDDCGDLGGEGGTVLVKSGLILRTASLWLRSDLTLKIEAGATLLGTATGNMKSLESTGDAPIVYTRRNSLMVWAHAGLLNAGRCLEVKDPKVGWDDCKKWSKLSNVVIEGGGTLDANGDEWYGEYVNKGGDSNTRPMMLDLLWVDGLTVRNISVRRPGYWTIHPTFCNNVVVANNDIVTYGHNTDGCDPDSSWNVYIAGNKFSTGDDCIAIKAGRDWSGRMVNISTTNVLAERNEFRQVRLCFFVVVVEIAMSHINNILFFFFFYFISSIFFYTGARHQHRFRNERMGAQRDVSRLYPQRN